VRVFLVLFAAAAALCLWLLLKPPEERPRPEGPATVDPAEAERQKLENQQYTRAHEVLSISAKRPDRRVPLGTEVGYRIDGKTRWQYADEYGTRVFTDAPIGTYEAVARAPGHPEVRQTVVVIAGVPAETNLLLRPETEEEPPPR
jgi:hypothetical protein